MLKSIRLINYKGFLDTKEIEIKPITLILGKNSSGKSSICKLFPILRDALTPPFKPLPLVSKEGVRLAWRYQDLFHKNDFTNLEFQLWDDRHGFISSSFFWDGKSLSRLRFALTKDRKSSAILTLRRKSEFDISENADFIGEKLIQQNETDVSSILPNVTFIGPIRGEAPVYLSLTNDFESNDSKGSHAYQYLLDSAVHDNNLIEQVNDWMRRNLDGQKLKLKETDVDFGRYSPLIVRENVSTHLSEVGEGITQVLPIITQSFLNMSNAITVLEQPALHLHPSVHAAVAERLAESSKQSGQRFVIESHSKNLMLGFLRMVAKKNSNFSKDDIAIYYLDSDELPFQIDRIFVDENGDLSSWPSGVFEESAEIEEQILRKV